MIRQRYIVMLDERADKQIWLAYDALGRVGNANYKEAFRYATHEEALRALASVRRDRRWPNAKVLGTTVDEFESK